jgi:hypothetical protein
MAAGSDAYYDSLFGPEAGINTGGVSAVGGMGKGVLNNPLLKSAGAGIFATWLLNKILQTKHSTGMRNIQMGAMRSQAEMTTPENLYYQAALPQAKEEETMAKSALLQHLSGGVLGPQLAKGEYRIGG